VRRCDPRVAKSHYFMSQLAFVDVVMLPNGPQHLDGARLVGRTYISETVQIATTDHTRRRDKTQSNFNLHVESTIVEVDIKNEIQNPQQQVVQHQKTIKMSSNYNYTEQKMRAVKTVVSSKSDVKTGLILQDTDVVSGRGGLANNHSGNILFRRLVAENKGAYLKCEKKSYKHFLAMSIIAAIEGLGGRFLRSVGGGIYESSESKKHVQWVHLSRDQAIAKTAQALREQDANSKAPTKEQRFVEKKRSLRAQQKQKSQAPQIIEDEPKIEATHSPVTSEAMNIDFMPHSLDHQLSVDYCASGADDELDRHCQDDVGHALNQPILDSHAQRFDHPRPCRLEARDQSVDINLLLAHVGVKLNEGVPFENSMVNSSSSSSLNENEELTNNALARPSMIEQRQQSFLQPHELEYFKFMGKEDLGHFASLFDN
jgi:hypothetical protein